ncbi:MAG: TonB-dependent receptor [Thalassotalea sp.]
MIKTNKKFKLLPLSLAIAGVLSSNFSYAEEIATDDIEVIQVSGIRSSLTKAMSLKQDAPSIQDSIVAEDIGKFPDQNVAESLQRISGVMISRTNGEGAQVTVRGFGPKFNAVKVNSRTMATTDRGREFDFQVLPSELISGADVIKASRANIAEGSLGAYINVGTSRPLTNPGFHAAGSVHMKYNDLSEEATPKFSGIVSDTFADDSIGVLVGVSRTESTSRIDYARTNLWASFQADNADYAPGPIQDVNGNAVTSGAIWYPGRAEYNLSTEERERTSANVTLQWSPTDDITHTFDYLYSDLSRQQFSNGMQIPLQYSGWTDVIVSENQTALSGTKESSPIDGLFQQIGQESTSELFGFNSIIYADKWVIEGDISYSKATSAPRGNTFVPHYINHTVDQSVEGQENGLTDADFIKFDSTGDVIGITSTIDWGNTDSVRAHWNDIRHQELKDEVFEAKLDTSYNFDGEFIQTIDLGIAYTDREKSQANFLIENGCSNQNLPTDTDAEIIIQGATNTCGTQRPMTDGIFDVSVGQGFLSDVPGNFPRNFVLINNLDQFIADIGNLRSEPDWAEELPDLAASVANTEESLALYAQVNFHREYGAFDLSGNIGARYVQTDVSSSGHRKERISIEKYVDPTRPDTGDGVVLEVEFTEPAEASISNEYDHFLPSLNLALDYRNGYFLKAAAAKVITRPSLGDTGVNRSYNNVRAESFSQSGGNPYLKPYEATQFDLALEYYDESGSAYSVNFFYKDISTFISTLTHTEDTGVDIDGWGDLIETVTEKSNRSGGSVSGYEIAGLHYFDYLPGWLSGFGVQANYTYTSSEDKQAIAEMLFQDGVVGAGGGLEGFSENAYNLIAFYEKDEFQARLAYNWRDDFLAARQGPRSNGQLAEHVEAYGQFDFSASYDVNENLTVSFEAINLTDENILEYADIRERVTLVQYSGVRYQLGVSAKF